MHILRVAEGNEENDGEHGGNWKEIVQSLEIGDNFAMNATPSNEENCQFYITCYEEPFFEVDENSLSDD